MYIKYNPNPNNSRVGDCVIRAIAKAENISWDKIYLDLCVYGLMCSDLPISNNVWGRFLNDRNYKYFSVPNTCPFCYSVKDFCKDNPNGTFVLGTGKHAICIIDGNYYDSWDRGGNRGGGGYSRDYSYRYSRDEAKKDMAEEIKELMQYAENETERSVLRQAAEMLKNNAEK